MPNTTPNYSFFLPLVDDPTDQDLWGGYLNDNFSSLDTLLGNLTPSGQIAVTAASSAPTGWLLCFGQAVSRTTYAALFAAISTTYGAGDGSTTFNLPDVRGRVIAGVDNMGGTPAGLITNTGGDSGIAGTTLGAIGGSQFITSHTHTATVDDPGHDHTIEIYNGGSGGIGAALSSTQNPQGTEPTGMANTGVTVTNTAYGAGASQNVQPTIMMNVIIKT